jgi:FMN phosphatase YigB (HAD superfamily)
MIKTILFDLDDTLLGNDMDTFLPHYFALLDKYAAKQLDVVDFVPSVLKASEVMTRNTDPTFTNNEVFWQEMNKLIGLDGIKTGVLFDNFYRGEFNQLQDITESLPVAAELIRTCLRKGYQVVIATNPMFPRLAVEARLNWAGIPVTEFPYEMVTTIENMHATKPHQAYYREILAELKCTPTEALMVGDDWQRDMEPAAGVGLFTYWIQLPGTILPDATLPSAYGSLEGLLARIESDWFHHLAVST